MGASLQLSVTKVAGSASVANNTSKIRITLDVTTNSGTWSHDGTTFGYINLDGVKIVNLDGKWADKNTTTRLYDGEHTVSHSADGSKTVQVDAGFDMNATYTRWSYASQTLALDTIPRATSLDSLTCSTNYFTGTMTARYTPKSSGFYNFCRILIYDGIRITVIRDIYLGKKAGAQQTLTVNLTAAELSAVYNALPSDSSATLRFALFTYSDSGYSQQVGLSVAQDLQLSIPQTADTKPTAGMALSPVSTLGSAFAGLYIQGKTKVDANFAGSGKYGASITGYGVSVEGKSYGSPYTSDLLTTPGSVAVRGTATDSRGFTGVQDASVTVLAYSAPQVLSASVARCDSAGNITGAGTYLRIKATRSYEKLLSGGVQKNRAVLQWRHKSTAGSFSGWSTLLEKTAATDTVDTVVGGGFAVTSSYAVELRVADDIGEAGTAAFVVPTESVYIHKAAGGDRLGVGKYAERAGLDIGWNTHMNGHRITGLGDPADAGDAVSKGYLEERLAALLSQLQS